MHRSIEVEATPRYWNDRKGKTPGKCKRTIIIKILTEYGTISIKTCKGLIRKRQKTGKRQGSGREDINRGHKGQKARTGYSKNFGFEGARCHYNGEFRSTDLKI